MDAEAQRALAELYERVAEHVAAHRPVCEMSGRCCDFPNVDHELFCSDLETDYAVASAGGEVPESPSGTCPWFVDGLCGLRDGRPLGCRLYFCDPNWSDAMTDAYERFHGELRALHERLGQEYRYRRFVDAAAERRGEAT